MLGTLILIGAFTLAFYIVGRIAIAIFCIPDNIRTWRRHRRIARRAHWTVPYQYNIEPKRWWQR